MGKFPKIKKELKRFVEDERGTISKKSILKVGVALTAITFLSSQVSAHHVSSISHGNSLGVVDSVPEATHTHSFTHNQSC